MGHSTHIDRITTAELAEYEKANPNNNIYTPRQTRADKLVSIAISKWHDDPDSDRGSASMGYATMEDVTPYEAIDEDKVYNAVNSNNSIVIPLMDPRDYVLKEITMAVKFDADEWEAYKKDHSSYNGVLARKVRELKDIDGAISSIRILPADGKKYQTNFDAWKISSSFEADTSGGKTKNVYFVAHNGRQYGETYETQALARKAANDFMAAHNEVSKVTVEARIKREDNTSLVTLTRKVKSATAKVLVTYVKVKSATPRQKDWEVLFDYHH